MQIVEVSKEIHDIFDESELIDIKQMNEYDRHIEHSVLLDSTLYNKSINKEYNLEEEVERKIIYENLHDAISTLSDIQRRRIILYYFENKTLSEIANIENCSIGAIKKSIDLAIKGIKKVLK